MCLRLIFKIAWWCYLCVVAIFLVQYRLVSNLSCPISPRKKVLAMIDIEDICKQYVDRAATSSSVVKIAFPEEYKVSVRCNLKSWYNINRRKMPWRGDSDRIPLSAYGVWVSEVMLQQTRVETVIDYWNRWMEVFPSIEKLAAATPEEVNKLWAGLGYYRRAQNLLAGAKHVMTQHNGVLPQNKKELLEIPGVGPYTAGAIASVAFGLAEPVVDGNVLRVFSRIFALQYALGSGKLEKACWQIAEDLVDREQPGMFNQAVMELGATLCKPTNPQCSLCPVQSSCQAFALTKMTKDTTPCNMKIVDFPREVIFFPQKVEKKKAKEVSLLVYVLRTTTRKEGELVVRYLFFKRPVKGLLANQWEFPTLPIVIKADDAANNDDGSEGGEEKEENGDQVAQYNQILHKQYLTEIDALLYKKGAAAWWSSASSSSASAAVDMYLERCNVVNYSLPPIVHVFSHEKHCMHIVVEDVQLIPITANGNGNGNNSKYIWQSVEEIVDSGITTGCWKILQAVEQTQNNKKNKATEKVNKKSSTTDGDANDRKSKQKKRGVDSFLSFQYQDNDDDHDKIDNKNESEKVHCEQEERKQDNDDVERTRRKKSTTVVKKNSKTICTNPTTVIDLMDDSSNATTQEEQEVVQEEGVGEEQEVEIVEVKSLTSTTTKKNVFHLLQQAQRKQAEEVNAKPKANKRARNTSTSNKL